MQIEDNRRLIHRPRLERNITGILLLLLLGGCFLIMQPFISALLWAIILCFSSWPLYVRLLKLFHGHRTLSALVMTLAMVLIVLLPFVLIASTIGDSINELTVAARRWVVTGLPPPPDWLARMPLVGHRAVDYWQTLAADRTKLLQETRRLIEPASALLLIVGKGLAAGLLQLSLSILIALFLFRDGETAARRLRAMLERVAGKRGVRLLTLAGATVRGVVYGILGTAMVQAVLAGMGFFIAGIPGAGMLALLTFFLSIVPMGPPLIWIPAAFWLYHEGSPGWALFMVIWGIGVSSIDNFVKPWLISHGSAMPFLLIFFGVLGGAAAFGFIGVFLGPTLLAVGYRIVTEWAAERDAAARVNISNMPPAEHAT